MLQSPIVAFELKHQQRGRPFRQLRRADHYAVRQPRTFRVFYDPRCRESRQSEAFTEWGC